nr:hypothetical protein B0A51_03275 [Rachicladosporium sp. CCFEE 5018]
MTEEGKHGRAQSRHQHPVATMHDDTAQHRDALDPSAGSADMRFLVHMPQSDTDREDHAFHQQLPVSLLHRDAWTPGTQGTAPRLQSAWTPTSGGNFVFATPYDHGNYAVPTATTGGANATESATARRSKKSPGIPGLDFEQPQKPYFQVGTVFWAEIPELAALSSKPSSESGSESSDAESVMSTESGNPISSKGRFYVVVQRREDHCVVLGCFTHGNQGVGKSHCRKSDFCIIYTGDVAPQPMPQERPRPAKREAGMRPRALRVLPIQRPPTTITKSNSRPLAPLYLKAATRLNLGKEYSPIDYGKLRLQHFGVLDTDGIAALVVQWRTVRR